MGIFDTFSIGLSGLRATQLGIGATSHNITNAQTEGYSRQRLIQSAASPFNTIPGDIGRGVSVDGVTRIHDEFVYKRLKQASNSLSYTKYSQQHLQEIAKRFPDLQDSGLQRDIANYFAAWNDFASHPYEGAQKANLVQFAQTLTDNINRTKKSLNEAQLSINDEIKTNIDDLNKLGRQIASINKEISRHEMVDPNRANDLRDKRDQLELTINKLVEIDISKGMFKTENIIDANMTDRGDAYRLGISGFPFVEGSNFHPIIVDNEKNRSVFNSLYYEREDGLKMELNQSLVGGKIGAMLDLRGRVISSAEYTGYPEDGTIQGYIDNLDALAKTISVQTNNIYAKSAQFSMTSSALKDVRPDTSLMQIDNSVQKGTFDVVVYNKQGTEVARRSINVNYTTIMDNTDPTITNDNTIVAQINKDKDDNDNNSPTDDLDDYFKAVYMFDPLTNTGNLSFVPLDSSNSYKIAIEDKGTNLPGVLGMSRVFEGLDADNIKVDSKLLRDPTSLQGYSAPAEGNNEVANSMVQMQYDKMTFYRRDRVEFDNTIQGFYRFLTAKIATDTETNDRMHETNEVIHNNVFAEQQSISGVNMDEELANLMKYQATYGANAKVITTIDKMLETLLTLKQ